jgi:hypothetical protein
LARQYTRSGTVNTIDFSPVPQDVPSLLPSARLATLNTPVCEFAMVEAWAQSMWLTLFCDTRNDILGRDLVDKVYTSISRCPNAVATGILHDPYTGTDIAFTRGNQVGAAVQIDHIVPLAYAWDMGARDWTSEMRTRFANDPANLMAVDGKSNQAKSDKEPAKWLPANTAYRCEYVTRFAAVLRTYGLSIDAPSAAVATKVAATCPPT